VLRAHDLGSPSAEASVSPSWTPTRALGGRSCHPQPYHLLARSVALFVLLGLGGVADVRRVFAQVVSTSTFDVPSGDARLRARFFAAQGVKSIATVLIVPGWRGDSLDASGMGALLSARRVNVPLINCRGVQQSTGRFSYVNAVDDLGAA